MTPSRDSKVQITALEANAVVILRLSDLDSHLEGGLIYPSKKVMHANARIDASVTIILEVLHLLVDLFVVSNLHLEDLVLVLMSVLKGAQVLLELPCLVLGKTRSKERGLEFLVGGTGIVGLAELINAGLCRGRFNNEIEFGITHG